MISGQASFGSTGAKSILLGFPVTEVQFYAGARSGVTETTGMDSFGHADANNQFSRPTTGSKAQKDPSRALVIYNSSGTRVVEAQVTGGWGTNILNFNVTLADANYPFDLVAR